MAESEAAEQPKRGGGGKRLKQINARIALLKNELKTLREERTTIRAGREARRTTKGEDKPTQA